MEGIRNSAGQTIIDGVLRWYRSGLAEDGSPFEEDGIGLPPDDIRCHLLEQDGEWDLLADKSASKSVVVRVMREAMELDMAAAAELLKSLPVVYRGTQTEAEWIGAKLREQGISSKIRLNEP